MDRQRAARMMRANEPVHKTVWFSSKGPDVVLLQRRLQLSRLYRISEGDEIGVFGRATEMSLKAFQAMKELRTDGVCGPKTWKALDSMSHAQPEDLRL